MRQIIVVCDGIWGDSGKGKATQYFMSKSYKYCCIRSVGGPNAGHTIYLGDKKLSVHQSPSGIYNPNCISFIGNACYINLDILLKEIKQCADIIGHLPVIYISKYAHIILPEYLELDKEKEDKQNYGSTKQGVSIAASKKFAYQGICIKDIHHEVIDLIKLVEPYEFFTELLPQNYDLIIEGSQGVGLDIHHSSLYPYVSAGSFSTYGLLDGVGYALAPDEVCMVLKAYGSYFGPTRMPGTFDDNDFRKYAGEFGTTTGRPRNLCWLHGGLLKRSTSLVRPSCIMLNRLDTLNWFAENGKAWSFLLEDGHEITFTEKALVDGKLTSAGCWFVDKIEKYCDAPVTLIGTGPKHTDVIERG